MQFWMNPDRYRGDTIKDNHLMASFYSKKDVDANFTPDLEFDLKVTLKKELADSDTQTIMSLLEKANSMEFDIFDLAKATDNNALLAVSLYFADYYRFFSTFEIDQNTFVQFTRKVEAKYRDVPYHNSTHAADVQQTLFYIINYGDLARVLNLTEHDVMCMLLAGCVHDMDHPGYNNGYLVNSRDSIANTYNDASVLENYHISLCFKLIQHRETNIFASFDLNKYKETRKKMISMVLATDNAKHFMELASFKAKINELSVFISREGK